MKRTVPNSPPARAGRIVCVLVCVGTVAVAHAAGPRATMQGRTPARVGAGPGDPCAVGQSAPGGAAPAPSASVGSMVRLMTGARSRTKPTGTPGIRPGGVLSQELWSSRVEAPQARPEAESSLALQRLIRQVRSVKFEDKNAGPTFTPPVEPEPAFQAPATQIVQANATGPIAPPATTSPAPDLVASLPPKARKTLEVLQQNPGRVRDPLEVAELLFLSGRPTEAAPFYAGALDQISRLDPSYDADRAWILFQLGNCLRETDSAKAQEAYMKLVSEYPASPWTELAKAHGRLLTWYQKSGSGPMATSPQL